MDNSRLPKVLLYGQLANAKRPPGRPLLRFKDKLKANIASMKIPNLWEKLALKRTEWRSLCYKHVSVKLGQYISMRVYRNQYVMVNFSHLVRVMLVAS